MTLTEKTTHVDEALDRLITQYRNSDKLKSIISIYSEQVQEIEAMLFDLLTERWLSTAVGEQLDGLGAIVGEDRQGRSDADYRIAIQARILINKSEGTPEQLIEIASLLASGSSITLREYFPASFTIEIDDVLDTELYSGTHDGGSGSATLEDSTASWSVNSLIGKTIINTTDDSVGIITANTATTVTATLYGGTDNDWDTGDAYSIFELPRQLAIAVHDAKAAGVGLNVLFAVGSDTFQWDTDGLGWDDGHWGGAL
jgi:hypothetical protein